MKNTTTALILVSVLATVAPILPPAYADSSQGEGARVPSGGLNTETASMRGAVYPANKSPTNVYQGLDWNRDGTFAAHPGFPLSASELKAQLEANKAYNAQMVRRIIDAGGINAPEQPVALASQPMAHFESFGEGHQMGSNGGE